MDTNRTRKEVSLGLRQRVISKHESGLGYTKIARELEIPRSPVQSLIKSFKKTGNLAPASRTGRQKVTTPEDDREIIREAKKNRRVSAEKIKEGFLVYYDKELSESTIRRQIKTTGMNGRAGRKKPFISKVNRAKRLAYAKKYQHFTVDDWKRVLFTDESPSNLYGSNGRIFVWRKPGEEFVDQCLVPTYKSGRQTVMVWGSIGYHGAGSLVFCPSKMNSNDYLEIVYSALPDSFVKLDLHVDFIFQQDNAPCHTAQRVMEFFDENAFNVLDHPPQSPYLNPIEHVWSYIGRRIRQSTPSSLEGLKTKILHLWNNIPQSFIQGLLDLMPKRLAMVIENKGATKY
ncbi:hypothetical protein Ae201684P_014424 [Aphanomyces euteiches]|uniref:Tc1-like transposase DDE domain-containing protein n=1 Tax=Aphanomyces euteiches TaxID=100861 RepID=A0A6G0WR42_9STRA|nr:hypothetical protein Ae201684_012528 [Aphanomyces euteiches]KAH9090628.1 hypothetical protein Ae201684P_014424 [Aphanomyces euteiches]